MKLCNVVMQYDLWIVVRDEHEVADVRDVALGIVQGGEPPSELVMYTIKHERDIPARLHDEKPFVSSSISDDEYKEYQGSTVPEIFTRLNKRSMH